IRERRRGERNALLQNHRWGAEGGRFHRGWRGQTTLRAAVRIACSGINHSPTGAEHGLVHDLIGHAEPRPDRIRIIFSERAVAAARSIAFEYDGPWKPAGARIGRSRG